MKDETAPHVASDKGIEVDLLFDILRDRCRFPGLCDGADDVSDLKSEESRE